MPPSKCQKSPGPGSCGERQIAGSGSVSHCPNSRARSAASAGGLTRGNFGPAPKSKSSAPQTRFTKKLKLYFLLGDEPPKKYRPFVDVERSLSSPANVQVFSTTQLVPGCRFAPNSLSKTRS